MSGRYLIFHKIHFFDPIIFLNQLIEMLIYFTNSEQLSFGMIHGNSSKLIPCFWSKSSHLFSVVLFKFFFPPKSVVTKEMTILHSFIALLTVSQRKRPY